MHFFSIQPPKLSKSFLLCKKIKTGCDFYVAQCRYSYVMG